LALRSSCVFSFQFLLYRKGSPHDLRLSFLVSFSGRILPDSWPDVTGLLAECNRITARMQSEYARSRNIYNIQNLLYNALR